MADYPALEIQFLRAPGRRLPSRPPLRAARRLRARPRSTRTRPARSGACSSAPSSQRDAAAAHWRSSRRACVRDLGARSARRGLGAALAGEPDAPIEARRADHRTAVGRAAPTAADARSARHHHRTLHRLRHRTSCDDAAVPAPAAAARAARRARARHRHRIGRPGAGRVEARRRATSSRSTTIRTRSTTRARTSPAMAPAPPSTSSRRSRSARASSAPTWSLANLTGRVLVRYAANCSSSSTVVAICSSAASRPMHGLVDVRPVVRGASRSCVNSAKANGRRCCCRRDNAKCRMPNGQRQLSFRHSPLAFAFCITNPPTRAGARQSRRSSRRRRGASAGRA